MRWHRRGFAAYWRWKSRSPGGRPRIGKEVRDLIRRMSFENPLWGAPRIHGELLRLGIDVAQSTVSIYMAPRRDRPSQTWKTFLRNHAEGMASIDLFVVPTIAFEQLYAFLVLSHRRRRLLGCRRDEVPRERLKEAKGIGTPATRAEIIGGLKKQGFLIAQGKQIVPTETGLSLFGILKQADPALVDPGVTAQLECLLDDVLVGKQEMIGAIDAVCYVAQRIIGKLKNGANAGGPTLLGAQVGNDAAAYPPTPAMKRFAHSLARQKGIKPPAGYKTSISICRAFLNQHAPKNADGETAGKVGPKPASPAQLLYAKKIAQGKGIVIPEEAKSNSAAMSAWIDFEPGHEATQAQSQDGQQAGGPPQLMLRASPQTAIRRGFASSRITRSISPMKATATKLRSSAGFAGSRGRCDVAKLAHGNAIYQNFSAAAGRRRRKTGARRIDHPRRARAPAAGPNSAFGTTRRAGSAVRRRPLVGRAADFTAVGDLACETALPAAHGQIAGRARDGRRRRRHAAPAPSLARIVAGADSADFPPPATSNKCRRWTTASDQDRS